MFKKISVNVSQNFYNDLEERTTKKGVESVSQSLREVGELGLRVEAAAENNQDNKTEEIDLLDEVKSIKAMLEHTMAWGLEARTYARMLMEHVPNNTREKNIELANEIKQKAKQNIKMKEYLDGKP